MNLQKCNGTQSQICKIIVNDQEITDPNKILSETRNFEEFFYKIKDFIDKVQLPKLNIDEINECDNEVPEK